MRIGRMVSRGGARVTWGPSLRRTRTRTERTRDRSRRAGAAEGGPRAPAHLRRAVRTAAPTATPRAGRPPPATRSRSATRARPFPHRAVRARRGNRTTPRRAPLGSRSASLDPPLQPVQRVAQLGRQLVAELVEELPDQRDLLAPLLEVDLEHRAQGLRRDFHAREVQRVLRRQEPDRGLDAAALAVAALEDPLQDARVVAE